MELLERYQSIFEDEDLNEGFHPGSKRPDTEGGKYTIKPGKGPESPGSRKLVPGFWKKKKAGRITKGMKTTTKAQRKISARKMVKTKKRNPGKMKKAVKKAKRTRKANK